MEFGHRVAAYLKLHSQVTKIDYPNEDKMIISNINIILDQMLF